MRPPGSGTYAYSRDLGLIKEKLSVRTFILPGRGGADIFIWGATGGACFATRGAVNGLCRTSMQWHDVTRKILGGHWGGQAKFWGGSGLPWHPPSSAPAPGS